MKSFQFVNLVQGSPEWLAFRRNGVGSSDVAAIIGASGAYASRNQVLAEKLGRTREVTDFQKRIYEQGHEWELVVREAVVQHFGRELAPAVVQSTEHPEFFASLDGFDADRGTILEVKSTVRSELIADLESGKVFAPWNCQVQWSMMITGATQAVLAVVDSNTGALLLHTVNADTNMQALLHGCAWDFVLEMQKCKAGQEVAANDPTVAEIARLKQVAKEAEARLEELNNQIKTLAQGLLDSSGATRLEAAGVSIAWQERAGAVNYKAIPELQGVDLEKYRGKPSRFVKVTVKAEGAANE